MTLVLRYSARSDRGLVRANNEDSVYAGPRLLALADGMGGHAAGEVASQLVIAALRPLDDDEPRGDLLASLGAAVREGNEAVADEVIENPELDGMGTTLTAILFSGKRMGLCHIGDSRAYLLRDGELTQITRDDTFVQTLVEEGRITADEAHTHPQRSLIMRALTGQEVEPTLIMRESRPGDRILICSDGLSDVVTEQTLRETLTSVEDHLQCADRLIELALRGGGPDNVTVIVADVIDVEYGQSTPIIGGAAAGAEDDYVPDPRTAAGRAAALRPPKSEPRRPSTLTDDEPPATKPRRRLWWLLAALAVVAVLIGGLFVGRAVINTNYYVGTQDGRVVVFRGLDGSLLGQSMNSEFKKVCVYDLNSDNPSVSPEDPGATCDGLALADLNEVARQSLPRRPTDQSSALRDARALAGQIRPLCPVRAPAPAPATPPTPGQTPSPEPTGTPSPSAPPSSAPNQAPPNDVATSDCRER